MKSSNTSEFPEIKAKMMTATPEEAFGIGRCGPVVFSPEVSYIIR